ncbi:DUF424 domain-containing protein [archaeon CG07_land_8_20_14_0_80_38_8]|nr:MAG: DUF424 domain-containing protein [archaeon CG07_land_8_20_14_0_80_38_8]PIU88821.1 MAG: DUF424 domain-containing protein [archaeon CG06_land_8_20_14_3_00_37_11]
MHGLRRQVPHKNMIFSKTHKSGNELLLSACDSSLIGSKLTNGEGGVIEVSENFYGNTETTPEQLLILIRSATIVNLLGQETIKAAAENKICTPENIITIQGVPHAQIFRIF